MRTKSARGSGPAQRWQPLTRARTAARSRLTRVTASAPPSLRFGSRSALQVGIEHRDTFLAHLQPSLLRLMPVGGDDDIVDAGREVQDELALLVAGRCQVARTHTDRSGESGA